MFKYITKNLRLFITKTQRFSISAKEFETIVFITKSAKASRSTYNEIIYLIRIRILTYTVCIFCFDCYRQ